MAAVVVNLVLQIPAFAQQSKGNTGAIFFEAHTLPFHLENGATSAKNIPETMLGGVAVFDYNNDGRPDIFFTNGANIASLSKDNPKYRNRLFRNDGDGKFTDVTESAGLAGTGYDIGVAAGDYDNDGYADLFVAGVHHSTLYHNNGDGTFTDVTKKSGLDAALNHPDPDFGPLWAVTAAWVDVNNDGLLDLFVVNYLQWSYSSQPSCMFDLVPDYCHPKFFKGQPNQLFLNNGDGTFREVSQQWSLRNHVGKGMGVAVADYDHDGRPDLFVTNDSTYNSLFHNLGNRFQEVALDSGVALTEDGGFISGMGGDFRDFNNDGYPDIAFAALIGQTFPLFQNSGKGDFHEITTQSGMRDASVRMSGYGAALYDFDNDGWKDLFVSGGHVQSVQLPGQPVAHYNAVFRNPGASGKWVELGADAGLQALPPARHRGCAFGDLDGDGRIDVVVTAIDRDAEVWMNRTQGAGHWLEIALRGTVSNRDGIGASIKVVSRRGVQFNHMTTSVCYASSSDGPLHFGLGPDTKADVVEIRWPSGVMQTLHNIKADQIVKVMEPQERGGASHR